MTEKPVGQNALGTPNEIMSSTIVFRDANTLSALSKTSKKKTMLSSSFYNILTDAFNFLFIWCKWESKMLHIYTWRCYFAPTLIRTTYIFIECHWSTCVKSCELIKCERSKYDRGSHILSLPSLYGYIFLFDHKGSNSYICTSICGPLSNGTLY